MQKKVLRACEIKIAVAEVMKNQKQQAAQSLLQNQMGTQGCQLTPLTVNRFLPSD